jgi:hypothetical protein
VKPEETRPLVETNPAPKILIFDKSKKKAIEVKSVCKVDLKEIVLEPVIKKEEDGAFKVSKNSEKSELDVLLDQDNPKIIIPTKLKEFKREVDEEEIMEGKCCHGDEMDELKGTIDE